MVSIVLNFLTAVHFIAMAGLAVYGIHRLWMIGCGLRLAPDGEGVQSVCRRTMPLVTVQIPLYNEPMVAGRIIDAAASLEWPGAKLEIQVLDDSDDETRFISNSHTAYWVERGINISVIRRNNRAGYKAGALAAGLEQAAGDFIAVFDADFVPEPDFLTKTLPYFIEEKVGMVQARWGFLNTEYSWLTRLQALLLSAHYLLHGLKSGLKAALVALPLLPVASIGLAPFFPWRC